MNIAHIVYLVRYNKKGNVKRSFEGRTNYVLEKVCFIICNVKRGKQRPLLITKTNTASDSEYYTIQHRQLDFELNLTNVK